MLYIECIIDIVVDSFYSLNSKGGNTMSRKDGIHYSSSKRYHILREEGVPMDEAYDIDKALQPLTFINLDALSRAVNKIKKGKP